MSESLPVELNGESVHAVDAPESFTAGGPFHLELSNAGGAVHVHVRVDEGLSPALRLREANHYVGTGETVRVPVGMVPDHGGATGHLDVVSGYGAQRERIRVTVAADVDGPGADRAAGASTTGDGGSPARTAGGDRSAKRSATGTGARGLVNRSPPAADRETAAFAGLSAVVVVIGAAVVLTVGELGVALVVGTLVAVTGWLLLR